MSNRKPTNVIQDDDLLLINGDAVKALDLIPDESVQLIVTSPPYNIRKVYERDDNMSLEQYIDWITPIIEKLYLKLRDGGSLCWQVGNFVKDGEVFPLDLYFYNIFIKLGLKLRNRIIWTFNSGLHASKRFSGRYETLLWFTKSDTYTFNLDPVRVPQLYPGKRHAARKGGTRAGKPSGNPLGKNPTDFWTFSAEEMFHVNPIWDIPNIKAAHAERTAHPCQFPHELVERCVLAFSLPGDTILDPFMGAGTTAVAAIKAGRKAIGVDKISDYILLTEKRVAELRQGLLPLRRSGMSVKTPPAAHAVTRVPAEWLGVE